MCVCYQHRSLIGSAAQDGADEAEETSLLRAEVDVLQQRATSIAAAADRDRQAAAARVSELERELHVSWGTTGAMLGWGHAMTRVCVLSDALWVYLWQEARAAEGRALDEAATARAQMQASQLASLHAAHTRTGATLSDARVELESARQVQLVIVATTHEYHTSSTQRHSHTHTHITDLQRWTVAQSSPSSPQPLSPPQVTATVPSPGFDAQVEVVASPPAPNDGTLARRPSLTQSTGTGATSTTTGMELTNAWPVRGQVGGRAERSLSGGGLSSGSVAGRTLSPSAPSAVSPSDMLADGAGVPRRDRKAPRLNGYADVSSLADSALPPSAGAGAGAGLPAQPIYSGGTGSPGSASHGSRGRGHRAARPSSTTDADAHQSPSSSSSSSSSGGGLPPSTSRMRHPLGGGGAFGGAVQTGAAPSGASSSSSSSDRISTGAARDALLRARHARAARIGSAAPPSKLATPTASAFVAHHRQQPLPPAPGSGNFQRITAGLRARIEMARAARKRSEQALLDG